MPTHYMRRYDLFLDAGFDDAEAQVEALAREIATLKLTSPATGAPDELLALRDAIHGRVSRLPAEQARLAALVPEWLAERNGDLAGVLWLARAEHGELLDLPGFLLGVFQAFLSSGRLQDALAFGRFVLDLRFDWNRVYGDAALAYAFLDERDPNPLVWRVLDELRGRQKLRVLELGCGIGNDALGLLRSPQSEAYVGVDLAVRALTRFRQRLDGTGITVEPQLLVGDLLQTLERHLPAGPAPNLVYSYSSLHYFPSAALQRIFELVRQLLLRNAPDPGWFAFAIKGAGSVWEGQGLPLYRPDVWVNHDGQSRWFPSQKALARQLDKAGFEIRMHEVHDHWGYSETGRRDVFHYVLCSPRAEFLGSGI
jgi:SAM-dependent methyltransferase